MKNRSDIIAEACSLVGGRGFVKDYPCDCEGCMDQQDPELRERFIVSWPGNPLDTCYNIRELRRSLQSG